ncbi:MAG: hypothetical protein ACFFBQ_16535 [Promethearchaeota archaeon]
MKSIDIDAKHLIRTYIDGIEEYLRNRTRLHPNEIDSLLNEINDFVYLRSSELAAKDRVNYNDVLKAIEECGSPSEICEQYLELDREEQPRPFTPKLTSSKPSPKKLQEGDSHPFKRPEGELNLKSMRLQDGFHEFWSNFSHFPFFILYRCFFLFFIIFLNVGIFFFNPILNFSLLPTSLTFSYPFYVRINSSLVHSEGFLRCYVSTLVAFFLVILEGWLISKWKTKLGEKGFDRSLDDSIIVIISRFTFLMLFFKTSLLFLPAYLLYTPIWLVLACFMERQLKSPFWEQKLGPWITSLGSSLTNSKDDGSKIIGSIDLTTINVKLTTSGKGITTILFGVLASSFLFPWIAMQPWFEHGNLYYDLSAVPMSATIFALLSLITMLGTLVVRRYYKLAKPSTDLKSAFGDSNVIIWLIRLLTFKTILILGFTDAFINISFSAAIVCVLIVFEITSDTSEGKSFMTWFGHALVKIGGTGTEVIDSRKEGKSTQEVRIRKNETHTSFSRIPPVRYQPRKEPIEPKAIVHEKKESKYVKHPSFVVNFFKGIGDIIKAFMMAIIMLLISFFEIFLAFSIIMTSSSYKGVYEIPALKMNGWGFSGFTLNPWRTILFLGVQVFIIVTFHWYGLTTKKTEGIILKVYRNLTRIFLVLDTFGIFINASIMGYGQIILILLIGLMFFSELTYWKAHSERKTVKLPASDRELPVHDDEGLLLNRSDFSKAS